MQGGGRFQTPLPLDQRMFYAIHHCNLQASVYIHSTSTRGSRMNTKPMACDSVVYIYMYAVIRVAIQIPLLLKKFQINNFTEYRYMSSAQMLNFIYVHTYTINTNLVACINLSLFSLQILYKIYTTFPTNWLVQDDIQYCSQKHTGRIKIQSFI